MKVMASGLLKLVVSYLAVVFVIMLMPVFLITQDLSAFEGIVNYLFNNKG
ncbi:MAG TPA: hypothetical protein VFF20_11185 [Pseudogracilibacillus sp.]|nr:hypothetical protein [Pseudogracilibacillus sp.]